MPFKNTTAGVIQNGTVASAGMVDNGGAKKAFALPDPHRTISPSIYSFNPVGVEMKLEVHPQNPLASLWDRAVSSFTS